MLLPSLRLLKLPSNLTFPHTARQSHRSSYLKRSMASLGTNTRKHKVTVVGSGNWGSAIAKIVAENTKQHGSLFEKEVQMWVYEEDVTMPKESRHYDASSELGLKPQKLTTLINRLHENVKYLPGVPLPENVIANPSLVDSVKNSTILIFNMPHQFIAKICDDMRGHIVPFARESIGNKLGIYCGALSGANIANEVALEKFSETTVAYDPPTMDSRHPTPQGTPQQSRRGSEEASSSSGKLKLQPLPAEYPPLTHENIKKLFHRPYFHVRMTSDVAGVSLGGALKNVVALAAGFVDGLGWGDNAKAAIMRVGILEEVKFGQKFFGESFMPSTMTEESCGVADMITSCSGGRNFRCAKMSVEKGLSIDEVEKQLLNGQKLQGTSTAYEVYGFLKRQGEEKSFPLFTAVYNILEGNAKPEQLPDLIESSEYPARL